MKRFLALAGLLAGLASPAKGGFHFWNIQEVYSNADGSVQFIEFLCPTANNGEHFMNGTGMRRTSGTPDFIFNHNLATTAPNGGLTGGRTFLVATPGFAALPGAVTPDFTLPSAPWFSVNGDTITFLNADNANEGMTFTGLLLPDNGFNSLRDTNPAGVANLVSELNSPKNFKGEAGSIVPPPPPVEGDTNGDRLVNRADAARFALNFGRTAGATVSTGDFTSDMMTTLADLGFLQARFDDLPASPATVIPEPSAWILGALALGFGSIGRVYRRYRAASV